MWFTGRNLAGHSPLREGGGAGPQLPGRLHQPGQCSQRGQNIRQVSNKLSPGKCSLLKSFEVYETVPRVLH